ncbi:MAG: DUF3089 domain-containing protein [Candidatus Mucispirillum faecigallinarum]|nr:DUF3089 domain-containing protein [Candidatus Mucispirillum faecigallinarum]
MKKIIMLFFILLAAGCINKENKSSVENIFAEKNNWLSLPDNITYKADVFYIYPTVCVSENSNMCSIDNSQMQHSAQRVLKLQADAFKNTANIFAPYYTQYDIDIFEYSNYKEIQENIRKNTKGLQEIYDALDYYFNHYNNGRPFILASHSQGSAMMQIVLSDYMKNHPEYYKNMIAAYVIGYPITKEFMLENPHLKFAACARDTGVIAAFEVEAPDKAGVDALYTEGRLVINPLSWKIDEELVKADKNLGSLNQRDLTITTPGIADAKLDLKKGVVICSTIDESMYQIPIPSVFGTGSYHGQSFQLYYVNLGENAKERIDAFLSEKN